MPLQEDTKFIAVSRGINVTQEARLVNPPSLLEAINSRFGRGGGSVKRRGHRGILVRGEKNIPAGSTNSDSDWLFGWGFAPTPYRPAGTTTTICGVSPDPTAGRLYGGAQRDQETVVWTGHSLLSYTPALVSESGSILADVGNAVMPSLSAAPIAKVQSGQILPDLADNGSIKIVTWKSTPVAPAIASIHYSIYDSVSNAPLVVDQILTSSLPYQARAIPMGDWVHVFISDLGDQTLKSYSIHKGAINTVVQRSYGPCNLGHFDLWKESETSFLVAKGNGSVEIIIATANGSFSPGSAITIPVTGALVNVAVASNPQTGEIGVTWFANAGSILGQIVQRDGTMLSPVANLAGDPDLRKLTIAPKYLLSTDDLNSPIFDVYWDNQSRALNMMRFSAAGSYGSVSTQNNAQLMSRGFRVGDRTYIWGAHKSIIQSVWLLLDEGLKPVGHQDFAIARVEDVNFDTTFTSSVNWVGTSIKNQARFHLALGYNTRVPSTSADTGVFAEPAVKETHLNFLPSLRHAQGGRALYIAGAQIWSYDGVELTEAGFHYGPELTDPSMSGGGSLTLLGSYFYRVDLCYKNAQGEEIRSLSILTKVTKLTGGNATITVTIPTCITRRTGSYFLVYRNAMQSGIPLTNLWLLNSRDPSSPKFLANDSTTAPFVTLVDDGTLFTDITIQNNELHPADTGFTYVQPIAGPACEIISAGRDRLWVSGGELPAGQVAPSRLFSPGDTPAWNPYLNIQVDRSAEAITAIGFVGEVAAFFRKNSAYILDSDGPDNSANGVWAPPRLALVDLGALGQESLALVSSGLIFQSPAGFRLLGPGGALSPIGVPVDEIARSFPVTSAVVINEDQEVRWYSNSGTIVYNYLHDCWSTWTVSGIAATRDLVSGLALVLRSDGYLLVESESHFLDIATPYTHRVRFPWLHAGDLGDFQRVRQISGVGNWTPGDGAHRVKVELYYDERAFPEETFEWVMPDPATTNADSWGAHNFGDGVWGDTNAVVNELNDTSWDWVRSPARQKCAVISIAVEDDNTEGPGFVLNALGLRLARKPGFNRIPDRGGSDTSR